MRLLTRNYYGLPYPCPRILRTCKSSRHQPLQLLGLMANVLLRHAVMIQALVGGLENWRTCLLHDS